MKAIEDEEDDSLSFEEKKNNLQLPLSRY